MKQKQETSEEISRLLQGLQKLRFNLTLVPDEQRPWQRTTQQIWDIKEKSPGNDWEHHLAYFLSVAFISQKCTCAVVKKQIVH